VQPDAGLIEYEQGIDERSAKRRGQIEAPNLAAGERARLPIQGEIKPGPTSHR
jgi:hypothetical protein